jgi:hypothetical protein
LSNSLSLYIINMSLSTLRIINIREFIIYNSVSHIVIYLINVFNNTIRNIEGNIGYKFLIFAYNYIQLYSVTYTYIIYLSNK